VPTKNCQNCTENVPFVDEIACFARLQACVYLPFSTCRQCAKEWEKGEFLSELRLSFHANDDQRKIAKFDNQTYLWSSKGPETSQQSTRNLALCVISMGWEKKKEKEHFKPQRQQLTCVTPVFIMVFFFASRSMPCCGLLRIAVFAAAFGSMMLLLTAYLVPGIVPAGTVVYVAPGFLDSYLLCI